MIRLLIINISLLIIFTGCISHIDKGLTSKKVTIDNREMLYGAISREQLYFDYPDWKQIEDEYEPSIDIIKQLTDYHDSILVDIFLGANR